MIIQWFPGHMNKALKLIENDIKIVDCILYVLDARAPFSCLNPKLNTLTKDKPIIYILNKSDMADEKTTVEWQKYFSKYNDCIVLNSTMSNATKSILPLVRKILSAKIEKYAKKNINTTIRMMVVGVPNGGKSTLINNLCGKNRTVTGNIAGVTRGKQWLRLEPGVEVMDTPGTLWPAFNNDIVAHNLAYIGSIKDDVLDLPSLSLDFITRLNVIDPNILEKRYGLEYDSSLTPLDSLETICKKRGYIFRGGDFDYDKGAKALFTDFRKGYLGKITLESVSDIKSLKKVTRVEKRKQDD